MLLGDSLHVRFRYFPDIKSPNGQNIIAVAGTASGTVTLLELEITTKNNGNNWFKCSLELKFMSYVSPTQNEILSCLVRSCPLVSGINTLFLYSAPSNAIYPTAYKQG